MGYLVQCDECKQTSDPQALGRWWLRAQWFNPTALPENVALSSSTFCSYECFAAWSAKRKQEREAGHALDYVLKKAQH
jgi:hypothetical protein